LEHKNKFGHFAAVGVFGEKAGVGPNRRRKCPEKKMVITPPGDGGIHDRMRWGKDGSSMMEELRSCSPGG